MEILDDFLSECGRRFDPKQPESFWDCESRFHELVTSDFLLGELNAQLKRQVQDPNYLGNWLADEWVLHRGQFNVTVMLRRRARQYIHVVPHLGMYAPLNGARIRGDRYALPEGYRNDVFNPALRLTPAGEFEVGEGELLRLDSSRYAYDVHHSEPVVVLAFLTTAVRTMEWLFARETLQAMQANDADLSFTQLRVAADILGKFAHQSSVGRLQDLTRHPHHAVRWAAVQSLGRLSRAAAIEALKVASNDPHPHVQRAARKTLERVMP